MVDEDLMRETVFILQNNYNYALDLNAFLKLFKDSYQSQIMPRISKSEFV